MIIEPPSTSITRAGEEGPQHLKTPQVKRGTQNLPTVITPGVKKKNWKQRLTGPYISKGKGGSVELGSWSFGKKMGGGSDRNHLTVKKHLSDPE